MSKEAIGLCWRCEHRARFNEMGGKWRPRCECGDVHTAYCGCYMYAPVVPFVLRRRRGDTRKFGYRVEAVGWAVGITANMLVPSGKKQARKWVRYHKPMRVK